MWQLIQSSVAAVVLLVVTGVYRALAELPSLASLWTTSYGVALLVKLIVFAVMLVLAAWNRLALHPRLERAALGLGSAGPGDGMGALRSSVRAEVSRLLPGTPCILSPNSTFLRTVSHGNSEYC